MKASLSPLPAPLKSGFRDSVAQDEWKNELFTDDKNSLIGLTASTTSVSGFSVLLLFDVVESQYLYLKQAKFEDPELSLILNGDV